MENALKKASDFVVVGLELFGRGYAGTRAPCWVMVEQKSVVGSNGSGVLVLPSSDVQSSHIQEDARDMLEEKTGFSPDSSCLIYLGEQYVNPLRSKDKAYFFYVRAGVTPDIIDRQAVPQAAVDSGGEVTNFRIIPEVDVYRLHPQSAITSAFLNAAHKAREFTQPSFSALYKEIASGRIKKWKIDPYKTQTAEDYEKGSAHQENRSKILYYTPPFVVQKSLEASFGHNGAPVP